MYDTICVLLLDWPFTMNEDEVKKLQDQLQQKVIVEVQDEKGCFSFQHIKHCLDNNEKNYVFIPTTEWREEDFERLEKLFCAYSSCKFLVAKPIFQQDDYNLSSIMKEMLEEKLKQVNGEMALNISYYLLGCLNEVDSIAKLQLFFAKDFFRTDGILDVIVQRFLLAYSSSKSKGA